MTSAPGDLPFSFDAFNAWYDGLRRGALEPARLTFCRILTEEATRVEIEFGPGRFRGPHSRVKDSMRLWAKMHLPKYRDQISSLGAIPDVIDDLVGVRVVCTNKSDIEKIRAVVDSWTRLAGETTDTNFGIAVESCSERDYIVKPKSSGYRAYHVNLLTSVPRIGGMVTVRGELQVRTLLQDGWGELTHEDTYKPGQEVPRLVSLLSLRMGELLATVDDIAEDIQGDLARLSEEAVTSTATTLDDGTVEAANQGAVSREIVVAEAARIISLLERPTPLARISNQLRSTFGPHVSANWRGPGNFRNFLVEAIPSIHIVPKGPSYVIPPGLERDESWPRSLLD